MAGDSKRPGKFSRRRRGDSTGTDNATGTSSSQRKKDNLDHLRRKLFPSKSTYRYTPIRKDEVRLLYLSPAESKRDMISAELKVVKLDDKLFFEALSYTWGFEEPTEKIWLRPMARPASPQPVQIPSQLPISGGEKARLVFKNHVRQIIEKYRSTPKEFYIRPNLSEALRHLREYPEHSPRENSKGPGVMILWIDAICMNQEDENEKSIQVAKMADIYRCADDVFVWLGKEADESALGMDLVEQIPEMEQENMLSIEGSSDRQWSAFISLMRREWFTRRWVVQELALAKDVYLLCGDNTVNWNMFVIAVEFFIQRLDTITAIYDTSGAFQEKLKSLGDIEASGAGKMISVTGKFVRGKQKLRNLESLVSELTMFEVGDPRDAVYALMALARDMPQSGQQKSWQPGMGFIDSGVVFQADYKKDILQVFKDFVAYCVHESNSLDIICRKWAPNQRFKRLTVQERVRLRGRRPPVEEFLLPSWIGLLIHSAFGLPRAGPRDRVAGNSLVDTPDRRRYKASGRRDAVISFGEVDHSNKDQPSLDLRNKNVLLNPSTYKVSAKATLAGLSGRKSNGTIYVRGYRVDHIDRISHRLFEGLIPREWLELGGWTKGSNDAEEASNIPEELWRTLVANRAPGGEDPPIWYSMVLSWAIKKRNANGDVHVANLIRQNQPERMVELLKRIQEVIWDKRFFLLSGTTNPPVPYRFGIAPSCANKGDIVCILLGCSVPVVLNPVDRTNPACGYRLMGEAYVHGLMDGEFPALSSYSRSSSNDIVAHSEEFCLV